MPASQPVDRIEEAAASLAPVLDWVSTRFGPVVHLEGFQLQRPDPVWWAYVADLARPLGNWFTPWPAGAAGTSIDAGQALQRVLGEIAERWVALNARPIDPIVVPPSGLPLSRRFPKCHAGEDSPPAFTGLESVSDPVTHVRMQRLDGGRNEWIPAGYVHLGFQPKSPEPPVTDPISTGLAFHGDLATAIWSGLCEVVERDALMLFWQLREPLPRIDLDNEAMPADIDERLWRLRRVGITPHLFDMTTDIGIPAVFCMLSADRYPHVTVGASCQPDPVSACTKALDEAVSIRIVMDRHRDEGLWAAPGFAWVDNLYRHAAIYADGRLNGAFDFLLENDRNLTLDELRMRSTERPARTLSDLCETARGWAERGFSILWCDLTSDEVRPFGHVVKIVVPEMVPLCQSYSARWLATPRLTAHAEPALGRSPEPSQFNPYPHPFA